MPIDSMSVPVMTSNAKEQPKTYNGEQIQGVFGFTKGEDVPTNSHRVASIAAGAASVISLTPDANYELTFYDATSQATIATGTPPAVIIRPAATSALATIANFDATAAALDDFLYNAQSGRPLRIHMLKGQGFLGIGNTTGSGKALLTWIRRID